MFHIREEKQSTIKQRVTACSTSTARVRIERMGTNKKTKIQDRMRNVNCTKIGNCKIRLRYFDLYS